MPTRRWVAHLAICILPPLSQVLIILSRDQFVTSTCSLAKVLECVIVELLSIVRDKDHGDSEATNDAFPDETSEILLHDSGQWFCLNSFSEVVNPHDEELELPYGNGERSYYVQSLLGKRLRGAH